MADANAQPTDEDIRALIDGAPDTPEPEVVEVDEPEAATEPAVEPDGIEALRANLAKAEEERAAAFAARKEAEERAARAEREAHDNRGRVQSGEVAQVNAALEILGGRVEQATVALQQAWEGGDYARASKLQAEIAKQQAQSFHLEQIKAAAEDRARQPQRQPAPQQQRDPAEVLASQLAPRSADWIRAHPEFARDQVKHTRMLAAHYDALEAGHAADSDDYFGYVEQRLGMRAAPQAAAAPPAQAARRAPIAAAPVSRDAPAGTKTQQVRISREQMEIMRGMGLTDKEIHAQAVRDAREKGRIQ